MRPRYVLDAFCRIGGVTKGLKAVWPDAVVVGVDIEQIDEYCGDQFVRGDAIEFIRTHGGEFCFVHASPPCQGENATTKGTNRARNAAIGRVHPKLIRPTREALRTIGRPWMMENVPGSEVRKDVRLCGEQFGLGVLMHRYFELGGWTTAQPPHPKHRGRVRGWRHGEYFEGPYVAAYGDGGGKATVQEMREAKGIDWCTDHFSLREAIPPAYAEWMARAYDTWRDDEATEPGMRGWTG